MAHRVLIVGGGFGGVAAARRLAKLHVPDCAITVLSDRPWIEYYGVLYRLIFGAPTSQACIPLKMIFDPSITVTVDRAMSVDSAKKIVLGKDGTAYPYDTLILAPGAEPAYFGIPGMQEHSVTMGNAHQALQMRENLRRTVAAMQNAAADERASLGRFIVIGGGATGVEISSELLLSGRLFAREMGMDPALIHVDLIEAMDRLLPQVEPAASARVLKRLQSLGVNVMLKTAVAAAADGSIQIKDGPTIRSRTIVWTAGVRGSSLLNTITGIEFDKRNRAIVDDQLRAKGVADIFVVGDCSSTQYSGMAQTAIIHGEFVADVIRAQHASRPLPIYKPMPAAYAIPAGKGWAEVKYLFIRAWGFPGYVLRRLADVHVYMLIMPYRHIHQAYFGTINLKKYGVTVD